MKHVVCFGANSDIAKALLRRFVEHEPSKVIMFGRDLISLQDLKRDLLNRGALGVEEYFFDATKPDSIREAFSKVEAVDYLICAHGCLPKKAMFSFADIERVFWINYFSHVLIAELALEIFMKQGFGKLVVFGSVAGDRGRKKVGYYAAAKAALDSSLSALRQEFSSYPNVQILTVKPGFIKTKMTSNVSGP
ncbi:MAG: SDR family NAD(P)-dependent oxidoreductase, partial [Deltaproteobacteria bacterium]|nr:SDR family NAD(P)-dependent oxidoreductase [Deltaproteobacteria bacterium]